MSAVLTGLLWFDVKEPETLPDIIRRYTYPHPQEPESFFSTYVLGKGRVGLPYGDRSKLHSIMGEVEIEDRRVEEPVDNPISLTGLVLRDYQQTAMTEVLDYIKDGGTTFNLAGSPGSGKTIMLSGIIVKLGVKTLILAHLSMLTEQIKKEMEQFTDAKVVVLDKNTTELGDINIGTSQLISMNPQLWGLIKKHIALIVVDEAESLASVTTLRILQRCHAKYRIAISATFTRSVDGRTPALTDIIGHKVITLVNDKLLKPTIIAVRCPEMFKKPLNKNWYKRSLVSFFKKHNDSISAKLKDIVISSLAKDRQVLIATDLKAFQEGYAEMLEKEGISCGIMNGGTSKKERTRILQEYDEGKIKVLIGFGILNAGLSIPKISVIIRVSTPGNIEKLSQLIGRGRRDFDGKQGCFFIDIMFRGFEYANEKRRRFYRKSVRQENWKFFESSFEAFEKKL